MPVPFVREVAYVRNGEIDTLVFAALDERGKTIVVASDIDELPMVFTAYRSQVIDILGLKGLVIVSGVAAR